MGVGPRHPCRRPGPRDRPPTVAGLGGGTAAGQPGRGQMAGGGRVRVGPAAGAVAFPPAGADHGRVPCGPPVHRRADPGGGRGAPRRRPVDRRPGRRPGRLVRPRAGGGQLRNPRRRRRPGRRRGRPPLAPARVGPPGRRRSRPAARRRSGAARAAQDVGGPGRGPRRRGREPRPRRAVPGGSRDGGDRPHSPARHRPGGGRGPHPPAVGRVGELHGQLHRRVRGHRQPPLCPGRAAGRNRQARRQPGPAAGDPALVRVGGVRPLQRGPPRRPPGSDRHLGGADPGGDPRRRWSRWEPAPADGARRTTATGPRPPAPGLGPPGRRARRPGDVRRGRRPGRGPGPRRPGAGMVRRRQRRRLAGPVRRHRPPPATGDARRRRRPRPRTRLPPGRAVAGDRHPPPRRGHRASRRPRRRPRPPHRHNRPLRPAPRPPATPGSGPGAPSTWPPGGCA